MARSPDLTPLYSHPWGIVKSKCFSEPAPRTIDELKVKVEGVISSIPDGNLGAMIDNICERMELSLAQNGAHIEHIVH